MPERLSSLSTWWTLIQQAHGESAEEVTAAQQLLLERYSGAVYRYLLGVVGDAHIAEELTQEFGLALISKKFHKASPEQGRFRNYVKTVLRHLGHKYHKADQRRPRSIADEVLGQIEAASESADFERVFDESWRAQLLDRTWQALKQAQPSFHAVLRQRADHPELKSKELAQLLSKELGKPLSADNVRQTLRRARQHFGDLLLHEVACSLDAPKVAELEEELSELRLLDYCKDALERCRKATG